ncbi:MAG: ribosome small subunit-dependent GTPase A [Miltoncostaeaceae bacterium]
MTHAAHPAPDDPSANLPAALGWEPRLDALLAEVDPSAVPARVVRVDRGTARLLSATGSAAAHLPGAAVGDHVALAPDGGAHLLPRRGAIARRAAGSGDSAQVLAANVDRVLVVHGADRPLHPRRIHRSLALAWEGGAEPVVVVTKSDLDPDGDVLAELTGAAPGTSVHAVGARTGEGLATVAGWAFPDRTLCLVGESGAGKSTLINALLGCAGPAAATAPVRGGDNKGRHTTTARHLLPLPGGGCIIDTPGIRELGLWGDGRGVAMAFADITALAAECRFSDCRHAGEPGCAVAAAVQRGDLDPSRVDSHARLVAEEEALERRRVPHQERAHGRRRSRMVREVVRSKGRRPR